MGLMYPTFLLNILVFSDPGFSLLKTAGYCNILTCILCNEFYAEDDLDQRNFHANLMVRTKLCPSSRVTCSSLNQSRFAAILNPLLLDDLDHTIPVHIEREIENLALFLRLNMQNCYSSFYHIFRNDRMSRTTNEEIERQEEERDEISEHSPDAGASDRGTCELCGA